MRLITFSCNQSLPLLGHPGIRDLMARAIGHARAVHGFELFAWVIMPNHAHVLMRPCCVSDPALIVPLAPMLVTIKQAVSQAVIARWKAMDAPILACLTTPRGSVRFWQPGGGHDRNVRDDAAFTRHVRYIHRNPVKRGLVERPDQWAWSSVHWWMGRRDEALVECDPPPGGCEGDGHGGGQGGINWSLWKGYM